MNLLRFSTIFHSPEYRTAAENIFKNFNEHLNDHPAALTGMVSAYIYYSSKPKQVWNTSLKNKLARMYGLEEEGMQLT